MGKYFNTLSKRLRGKKEPLKHDPFWDHPPSLNFVKVPFEEKFSRDEYRHRQKACMTSKQADIWYDLYCTMEH
jgi:hypothetical protein